MKAENVEQLVYALESFDSEEQLILGIRNGRVCLLIGDHRVAINIPSELSKIIIT